MAWKLETPDLDKNVSSGLPWRLSGKEFACQCKRHGFNPWSGKIPHALGQLSHTPQLWSLCSATREATTMRSLCTATREQPPLTTTERPKQQRRLSRAKQKEREKIIYIKRMCLLFLHGLPSGITGHYRGWYQSDRKQWEGTTV